MEGQSIVDETEDLATSKKLYENCIQRLNSLQTSAEEIQRLRKEGKIIERLHRPEIARTMLQYFERCGITMEDINQLPVIHVTGSKGKGSVCAFCESILRKYKLRTGLLTSPHLIEVRERIRLNGRPIAYNKYSRYFTEVFDRLENTKADFDGQMPLYNRMHTIIAFYSFIKEKVDVAVIEVGCGGQYDSTNFVQETTVAGITSLALEHLKTLGGTLTSIAWHKSGIFKPGRPAFTVPQPLEGMEVINKRSKEIGSTIQCVPKLEDCIPESESIQLGLAGSHQHINASLAVQLCRRFLEERNLVTSFKSINTSGIPPPSKRMKSKGDTEQKDQTDGSDLGMTSADTFDLPEEFITGLRDCYWPGRTQTIFKDKVTYYLDCAHTTDSMKHCMDWFTKAANKEEQEIEGCTVKILVFNMKPYKYNPSILIPLVDCDFDAAVFCPSLVDEKENSAELTFIFKTDEEQRLQSQNMKELFQVLQRSRMPLSPEYGNENTANSVPETSSDKTENSEMKVKGLPVPQKQPFKCFWLPCIKDALGWATGGRDPELVPHKNEAVPLIEEVENADHIQVLITGSIYLVGGAMKLLDPELASR